MNVWLQVLLAVEGVFRIMNSKMVISIMLATPDGFLGVYDMTALLEYLNVKFNKFTCLEPIVNKTIQMESLES